MPIATWYDLRVGGITADLTKIELRKPNESLEMEDDQFQIALPGRWSAYVQENDTDDGDQDIYLIDRQSNAQGKLRILAKDSLDEDEQSSQAWAEKSLEKLRRKTKGFKMRGDGIRIAKTEGQEVATVVIDFSQNKKAMTGYAVAVIGENSAATLQFMLPADQFEALHGDLETLTHALPGQINRENKSMQFLTSSNTGRDASLWPVFLLLLAVLVPSGGVIWMMRQAMENERLAVRQRLADVYASQLQSAQQRVNTKWKQQQTELDRQASGKPAGLLFEQRILDGLADSAIVWGTGGETLYPDRLPRSSVANAELHQLENSEAPIARMDGCRRQAARPLEPLRFAAPLRPATPLLDARAYRAMAQRVSIRYLGWRVLGGGLFGGV